MLIRFSERSNWQSPAWTSAFQRFFRGRVGSYFWYQGSFDSEPSSWFEVEP